MSWRLRQLGEFISIKHGWAFKGEHFTDSGEYIVLTPGNAYERGGLKLRPGKEKYYSGDFPPEYLMKAGEMLVVMTDLVQAAPILGGAIVIPEDDRFLHNQRLGLVELQSNEAVDSGFLYYLLNSPNYKAQVRASATGATVRHSAPKRICECNVLVPDSISEQRQVAHLLSAYDDLIATNQRRIALLEQAARLLYREWFVRFQFPGNDIAETENGVPVGWSKGTAHDFVSVLSGGTPKTGMPHYWGGEIPFFTPKDCPSNFYVVDTEKQLTDAGLDSCNSRLYPRNTTFITARGTVGKIALAQRPMAMNQSCYALAPKQPYDELFLFLAISDAVEHFKQVAVGGVFDAIVVDTFKVIPFVLPTLELAGRFGDLVRPKFEQIENLLLQNRQLARARDLLLPKLMSGQLDVSRIPMPGEAVA